MEKGGEGEERREKVKKEREKASGKEGKVGKEGKMEEAVCEGEFGVREMWRDEGERRMEGKRGSKIRVMSENGEDK